MSLRWFRYLIYSFPLQLLVLHLKKHHLLLIFWALLFSFVLRYNGGHYGIPLLFLDPEYMGKVTYLGFTIVGFALGGFVMAWNISFYILNSYRFHFMAAISKPFVKFSLNNSLIPIAFIITYSVCIFKFQRSEGLNNSQILTMIAGFYSGIAFMLLINVIYFTFLNRDIDSWLRKMSDKAKEKLSSRNIILNRLEKREHDDTQWPVEIYFVNPFKVRLVRDTGHYDRLLVAKVLWQHHRTGFVMQFVSIVSLFCFGALMDNETFRIPAAAGILLFFTMIAVLASAITYWAKGWRVIAIVVIILALNFITKNDFLVYRHKLIGLDYTKPKATFDLDFLQQSSTSAILNKDIEQSKEILDNWHQKIRRKYGDRKPPIIFVNAAGGGMKSSYWVMDILQHVDSLTQGKLFDHCVLITGASGGMFGAAYFRELKLRSQTDNAVDPYRKMYLQDIGKDMLNPIITAFVTNDIFTPWQNVKIDGKTYRKDRGYLFDKVFNENTHNLLNKPLSAYAEPEQKALIPMMIFSPTIINDQRVLIISPQQLSYLTRPYIQNSKGYLDYLAPDAIEFMPFFSDYGSGNVSLATVLRMQATFPYILPPVFLPTDPELKVMDAGIRENYGIGMSSRFYNVFKDWIDANTSGAIFIQLRTDPRFIEPADMKKTTFLSGLTSPIGSIYSNFMVEQEYTNDYTIGMLENSGITDISLINFAYVPTDKKEEAGMNYHLSEREKRELRAARSSKANQESIRRLLELLN